MASVCTDTHVHVQCKHGFVLISGLRDDSLQPVCHRPKCKVEGERWLRSAGLTRSQLVGAIDSACTGLPPLSGGMETHQTEEAVTAEVTATVSAKEQLQAERESFTFEEARDYLRGTDPAYSSAFVGVGVAIGAIGTFKTRMFKPLRG